MPTGSNWNKLKNKLTQSTTCNNTKAKNIATDSPLEKEGKRSKKQKERKSNLEKVEDSNSKKSWRRKNGDYVGLDCEMVGIGADGKKSALARACLVDFSGTVIYDKFVRPKGFVTDFRTQWSGVRKRDLREGEAVAFEECQNDVARLIKGKVLVGHALKNDLDVLMLSHNRHMIRDTAKYKPYMRKHGFKMRPRALRDLVMQYFGQKIQDGEHDPGIDARSAMFLYKHKQEEWEDNLKAIRKNFIALTPAEHPVAKSPTDSSSVDMTSSITTAKASSTTTATSTSSSSVQIAPTSASAVAKSNKRNTSASKSSSLPKKRKDQTSTSGMFSSGLSSDGAQSIAEVDALLKRRKITG